MIIDVSVFDEISPSFQRMLAHNKVWARHVIKSLGWWSQKVIKAQTKMGEPNGATFKKRTPYKRVRAKLAQHAPTSWYGKMKQAIGYEYKDGGVNLGWTSRLSARYANIQEYGATRQVTEGVRKRFAAAGVPLSANKKNIKIPARPIFDPMSIYIEAHIPGYVEEKIEEYMTENIEFGKKKRRVYKVYKT